MIYIIHVLHFYLFPHRFMNNISTSLFLCVHNCTDFICVLLLPPISCLTEMRQLWWSGQFNADSSQVDSNIHWLGQSSWGAFASSAVLGRYKDLGPFEALLESWSYDILWLDFSCFIFTSSWNWLILSDASLPPQVTFKPGNIQSKFLLQQLRCALFVFRT